MLSTLTVSRLKPPKSGRREVYDRQVPGFGIRITDRGVKSLVSVKGETRAQRCISSESLWKWIDAHGKEFGIGRPYLDKDPPHVGPIDGKEYAEKRNDQAPQISCARRSQQDETDTVEGEKHLGLLRV